MMSSSKGASKAIKSAQHAQVPGASAGSSRHRHDSGKSSLKKTPKLGKDGGALRASIHAKRILSGKIGKRPINGYVSRTMKNQHKLNIGHRPKRNAIYRAWDYTAGLSWKEEKELKKAISASLQESKKPTKPTGLDGNDLTEMTDSNISSEHFQSGFVKHGKKSLKLQMPDHKQLDSQPPSSDTSAKSLTFQGQVRAQRKFAQGSRPCSPGCSPAKGKNSQQNKMLTTKKAKTEDFLTFLCLRGSPSLPPHLDFMNNTAECESLPSFPNTPRHSQDGSRPSTPLATPTGNRGRNGDSSRCESPDVEITLESNDLGVKPLVSEVISPVKRGGGMLPCTRARASLTNKSTRCVTNTASPSLSGLFSANTSSPNSTGASTSDSSTGGYRPKPRSREPGSPEPSVSGKRYATRGKQTTVKEIIEARAQRASFETYKYNDRHKSKALRCCTITREQGQIPRIPAQGSRSLRKSSRLHSAGDSDRSYCEDTEAYQEGVDTTVTQTVISPDDVDPAGGATCEQQTPIIGIDEDVHEDQLEMMNDTSAEDEVQNDLADSLDKLEMATQTSDTSSYTAEILPCHLLEESDTSEEEDDDEDDEKETETETSLTETEGEMSVEQREGGDKGVGKIETSELSPEEIEAQTVTTCMEIVQSCESEDQHCIEQQHIADQAIAQVHNPGNYGNMQISTLAQTIGSPAITLPQPGILTYTNPSLPLQACTMLGQGMLLDNSAQPVILNNPTQVLNNVSLQMHGFSVQQGLTSVDNVSCVQPSLTINNPTQLLEQTNSNFPTPVTLTVMPNPPQTSGFIFPGNNHSNQSYSGNNGNHGNQAFISNNPSNESLQPLDTPDSTPVKNSNGTRTCNSMTMEADTTVADDNVSDDTNDVVIVHPEIEKSESKSPYGRLSLGKMRRESNKAVTKSARHSRERSVSRSPQRPLSTPSPRRSRSSPSPRRPNSAISPKKQKKIVESEDNTEQKSRTLRSGIITSEPEVVDLTETDDQSEPKKEEDKSTSRRLGRKATLSPAHECLDSEGVPTRKRLKSGDSATSRETSVTPDRALRRSAVKRQLNTPSTSQEETVTPSRRAHLRSATSSPMPSPAGCDIRLASDNRLSADRNREHLSPESSKLDTGCEVKKDSSIRDNFKREDSRHKSSNRSKPGSVPKAAIRSSFPKPHEPSRLTVAPTYHPSAEQFQDPITYLETIRADAESYGMCRIVPPEGWKPECNISEDLRFSTQVQYIHKMANRWGPCVKTLECIKQHLKSQDLTLEHPPCTGGVEIDLPALSEVVQTLGGLQQVINKNKWPKVIDLMNLPKSCQQRTSQLYDIYCKYLLSYETLGLEEKHRLQQDVESRHQRGSKHIDTTCSTKGRSKPLGEFFRIAQNTQSMWFKEDEPTTEQVEELYWEMVCKREKHVSVQIAHIDTKHCGSAFPAKKDCPYSRHGWNYNILQHHSSSVLKHLGQVTGLTVPMLHIGMLFSTSCWARDPHFLPYIVYSHSGADVIWYCSPTSEESKFKKALEEEAPNLIDSQSPIWLPEDTVMTEPSVLLDQGVSLCRTVQKQGEFIIVFPKAFTATVSCGYNISESLHFASDTWLPLGFEAAELLYASGEPDLFSMERLLVLLGTGDKIPIHTLQIVLPLLEKVVDAELDLRKRLGEAGLQQAKKIKRLEELQQIRKRSNVDLRSDNEIRCDLSSKICFFSTVVNELEGISFALQDALQHIRRKKNLRSCKLLYTYDQKELRDIVEQVKNRISSGRHSGRKKSSSKSR